MAVMNYSVVILSLAACSLLAFVISSHRRQQALKLLSQQHNCQPPKCLPNKWFPPLGLDKLDKVIAAEKTRTYPLLMLQEHETHGDTYTQYGGGVFTVITRDPRNIREVLSRQFKSFDIGHARHGCVMPLLGDGIFTQDGEKWSRSRKQLAPLVQRPSLPDLQLIERHFQRLLTKIEAKAGQTMDMKDYLFDLSLELTTEFLLGEVPADGGSQASSWLTSLVVELNTAFAWIARRERLKVFYWLVDGFQFRRSCSAAQRIVADLVAKAAKDVRASGEDSYVAFAPLLQQGSNQDNIRDQVLNLLLAGRDTSGVLLCWIFYVLGRDSNLVKILKTEILATLTEDKTRCPSKHELNGMKKLDNFITETLRFFPPVPINGRLSNADAVLPHGGGKDGEAPFVVPKGSIVAFSAFATQRSTALYGPDADKFDIDRWDNDQVKERRMIDWSFHPFIGGPRKCIGGESVTPSQSYG
ncbi:hypothetical protein AMS68_003450 [Peltaster fructicola]|uniref:Cytochrome P450 n=1 Tax=Peltaster fructicola TaxID=286661 RepID=A0A6H0XT85_9PEZI|nr:hypothetical protein AMS68_003450 [Peltaster fructicola]